MLFANPKSEELISIKIGKVNITQEHHAELLGITFNEKKMEGSDLWEWWSHKFC